jgi:hypothetical protein
MLKGEIKKRIKIYNPSQSKPTSSISDVSRWTEITL